jgi:hypothetical protein
LKRAGFAPEPAAVNERVGYPSRKSGCWLIVASLRAERETPKLWF